MGHLFILDCNQKANEVGKKCRQIVVKITFFFFFFFDQE